MRTTSTAPGAFALILALVLAGCSTESQSPAAAPESAMGSSGSAMPEGPAASGTAMAPDSEAMAAKGAWIDRAAYESDPATHHAAGDVVLFFNANWCPTCRAAVKTLDAEGAPAGLTVVSVDYDASSDLRSRYGVTVQHTFVQVDADGTELARFTGSTSGAAIAAKTV